MKSWVKFIVVGCCIFDGMFYASLMGTARSVQKCYGGIIKKGK